MSILISNNPENLAAVKPHVTVEAEYGETVVEGSLLTLAHHGTRSGNPAPCIAEVPERVLPLGDARIGISHVDLDTIGGIAKVVGAVIIGGTSDEGFWKLAAFIDVKGPHWMKEAEMFADHEDILNLYAYWAWAQDHKVFAPRDGSVADVEEQVFEHIEVLGDILGYGDDAVRKDLIDCGRIFRQAEVKLNRESLHGVVETPVGKVAVRSAEGFTNHLYTTADGEVCTAVLAFNEKFKSITLSFSDEQGNACELMQKAFGPEAGGHAGIAGTPRGKEYTFDDHMDVLAVLI